MICERPACARFRGRGVDHASRTTSHTPYAYLSITPLEVTVRSTLTIGTGYLLAHIGSSSNTPCWREYGLQPEAKRTLERFSEKEPIVSAFSPERTQITYILPICLPAGGNRDALETVQALESATQSVFSVRYVAATSGKGTRLPEWFMLARPYTIETLDALEDEWITDARQWFKAVGLGDIQ